jgi:hypothetical protein
MFTFYTTRRGQECELCEFFYLEIRWDFDEPWTQREYTQVSDVAGVVLHFHTALQHCPHSNRASSHELVAVRLR